MKACGAVVPLDTEGLMVIAAGGAVTAPCQGNSASYSNDRCPMNTGMFIFNSSVLGGG